MARIKSYQNDNTLSLSDRLLGTDGNGANSTQNFSLADLKEFVALGIDIAKRTPRHQIPVMNSTSDDAETSGIIRKLVPSATVVRFYNTDPGRAEDEATESIQIAKAQFTLFNSGDGYFLDIRNYEGAFDIYSFAGKKFQATAGVDNTTVTGTIGALQEVDEKFYIIDADGDVIFRFALTRTGDLPSTWEMLASSRPIATEFFIFATSTNTLLDNSGVSLNRVNISISGDVTLQDLSVEGEVDFGTIPFEEHEEGIIYQNKEGTGNNSVNLLLNTNPPSNTNVFGYAGYANRGGVMEISGTGGVDGMNTFTPYFNTRIANFHYDNLIFRTTDDVMTDDPDDSSSTEVSQRTLAINHGGITTTYTDGTDAGPIVPVSANQNFNETPYKRPAAGTRTIGPQIEGTLTSLQIGDELWNIPTSVSQVAQVLPGLSEELSGIPNGISEVVSRRTIGRSNATAFTSRTEAISAWAADEGLFAFYSNSLVSATLGISGTNLQWSGTGAFSLGVNTTTTSVTGSRYFVIENNAFGTLVDNDTITIYDNQAASTASLSFSVNGTPVTTTIGGQVYAVLPIDGISYSGTAFALSGSYQASVSRDSGSSSLTPGFWFYGIDRGTYAEYRSPITDRSDIAAQPTGVPALPVDTTTYIGATGNVFNQNAVLNTAFANIPTGQRLFFVGTDPSLTTPGAGATGPTVPGNVFEVVAYIHDNGNAVSSTDQATLTWSRVGQGELILSSDNFHMTNIPETTLASPSFLVLNNTTGDTEHRVEQLDVTQVAGIQAVMNYDIDERPGIEGTVTEIGFESSARNHNVTWTGGVIQADITGRIPIHTTVLTGNATLTEWTSYILQDPTAAASRTLTLPGSTELTPGDKIEIHNLSDIDASDGSPHPIVNPWMIVTPGSDRIMYSTTALVLNEANSFSLIWTGIDAVGWLVS